MPPDKCTLRRQDGLRWSTTALRQSVAHHLQLLWERRAWTRTMRKRCLCQETGLWEEPLGPAPTPRCSEEMLTQTSLAPSLRMHPPALLSLYFDTVYCHFNSPSLALVLLSSVETDKGWHNVWRNDASKTLETAMHSAPSLHVCLKIIASFRPVF